MATIEVSELEIGMVLANDLRAPNGRFLLGKGAKVSSDILEVIKTWGVVEVEVEGISEGEIELKRTSHVDPDKLKIAEMLTRQRFIHANLDHEVINQLFQICVLKKAEELLDCDNQIVVQELESSTLQMSPQPFEETVERKIKADSLVQDKIKLPSLPAIFNQINEALNDPRSSATHLGSIIKNDSSLSALLLKLVNSAFYGFPTKIDTISRAITIIGTKELSTLALGTCAIKMFKDIPSDLIDMKSFWQHSITCGIIARIIGSHVKKNVSSERLFLCGLLHDIGRLPIFQCLPVQAKATLLKARQTKKLLYQTEQEILGFDHALVGGMLVKSWRFPLILEKSISFHHSFTDRKECWEAALVHISDVVANTLAIGTSGEVFVPPMELKVWEETGLSIGVLKAVIKQAEPYIEETVNIFFPNE